eukprot:TRINITY_DN505_c0_g1_i8.p1 TRINITY_DN505_c0_g1~~TRINITY_DN505_c0_g1_i8.p1  ORF type:complete len:738 (-),score=237.15 TRINITY_DN505_c0_g1_i8:103-2316(-)
MKSSSAAVVLCSLSATASATITRAAASSGSPVEKVVKLLSDLQVKITQDGKEEQKVYDKYACWCEKTSSRKADSINKAREDLRSLGQGVLKYKGEVAVLSSEMKHLSKEMKRNEEEQAEATAIRQRENAAFVAETTEMKQALAALQQAIKVLVKGASPSMLEQQNAESSESLAAAAVSVAQLIEALPQSVSLKPDQVALLSDFATSRSASKYAPQSTTIQGILKDMYETFSSDLESSTHTEATANRNFETLIAVKSAELLSLRETHAKKAAAKAAAEENLADTSQSYDDTNNQMKADIDFFDTTKDACETKSEEWSDRKNLRAEELSGIRQALEILTSDDARELFASSIKAGKETGASDKYDTGRDIAPSFLQVVGTASTADRTSAHEGAYAALRTVATKMHSLRLGMLAVRVKEADVGHFDQVITAINNMIQTLKDEDSADIAKRDQCIDEYKKIDSTVAKVSWLIEKNEAKIDKLESLIAEKIEEKQKTIADIKDVQTQMDDMTAERTAENQAFKEAKKEDQAAIDLLMQARAVLSAYYKKNSVAMGPIQGETKGLALVEEEPVFEVSADQASDATFSDKGKRKNEAKGIVQILTMLIEDANDEIKNGMKLEESSQLAFEKAMAAAKKLEADLITKKDNLVVMIGNKQEEKSDEHNLKQENEADLKDERDYRASIKGDCDWILKAFGDRASRRQAEMQGLTKAKEFLAGYQPPALLAEKQGTADLSRVNFLSLGR